MNSFIKYVAGNISGYDELFSFLFLQQVDIDRITSLDNEVNCYFLYAIVLSIQ